ncbi:TetR/AcrR family transcriptional regulator [Novosphingobium sp. BL-52-GroH]|uniref:TetR/AcrR family transcriptional regulator n=1 Tax=Novosphingobium sp. BL-52-GroH TaxID=3349877 RepID=UPI00384E4467
MLISISFGEAVWQVSKILEAQENSLDAHPDKPRVYASPSILERRRRILKETRLMVAEDGYEFFSVRKLCQRAEVAQRTLYNSFQNKDRLIAIALREAIKDLHRKEKYNTERNSVAGILDRAITAHRHNFRVPNYAKAVTSIYFGSNTPTDVRDSLRDISIQRTREWLAHMNANGHVEPWVDEAKFADIVADAQYAVINDWAQGRVSNEGYIFCLVETMVLLISGATRGPVREEAAQIMTEMRATGMLPKFS